MVTCTFESGARAALRHVVVHAVVERDGALLLVKRAAHLTEGGKWGLPGGFLDRDERLADGVLRSSGRKRAGPARYDACSASTHGPIGHERTARTSPSSS